MIGCDQIADREYLEELYFTAPDDDDIGEDAASDYDSDGPDDEHYNWEPVFGSAKAYTRLW